MRLAAIIPCGPLDRYGYQHTARLCIASASAGAERVFLVSSTRDDGEAHRIAFDHWNVCVISDERTWFARKPDGSEWFDCYRVMENINIGMQSAAEAHCQQAVCLMCNWYVPPGAWGWIRTPALGWSWLYRRDALAGALYHTHRRIPFIVSVGADARYTTDALAYRGQVIAWETDDFRQRDLDAVVDLQYELTAEELEDKHAFIRNYADIKAKNRAEFSLPDYIAHHRNRFRERVLSGDRLESVLDYGGFVSRKIEEGL